MGKINSDLRAFLQNCSKLVSLGILSPSVLFPEGSEVQLKLFNLWTCYHISYIGCFWTHEVAVSLKMKRDLVTGELK